MNGSGEGSGAGTGPGHVAPTGDAGATSAAVAAPGDLGHRIGYLLKRAQGALHSRMDARLRPLGLTVPQYVCLENLRQRPGQSNAELARAGFVSAQSMNAVVKGLQSRGLITRPATAPSGRRLPIEITDEGLGLLDAADGHVRDIEAQMIAALEGESAGECVGGSGAAEAMLDGLGALIRTLDEED